jgi:hypothetical protein
MESPQVNATEAYPLELHYVRALFLEKQYRQCIATCRQVLNSSDSATDSHPMRQTFVRFYIALAHDELARAMHNFSQAKIPAFNQAEQFYEEALSALPTPAECLAFTTREPEETLSQQSPKRETTSRHDSLHSFPAAEHSRSGSVMRSLPLSPQTHIRNDSLPMRSPPISVTGAAASEDDDLESHDSFNDIMTPGRLPKLDRDYSSMSLLQPAQRQISYSLMRPVRMGSPAKPYQLPSAPAAKSTLQQRSLLPRLDTNSQTGSPVQKQLRTASELTSPIESPVSPLDSDGDSVISDSSTISPVSPETPYGSWWSSRNHDQYQAEQQYLRLVGAHLQAMRTQLQSHLNLLHAAKLKTSDTQSERSLAHATNDRRMKEMSSKSQPGANGNSLPSERSYWSFTPEDVRIVEKQNRIQAGRAREWKKERFDPTKYRDLADAALSEL